MKALPIILLSLLVFYLPNVTDAQKLSDGGNMVRIADQFDENDKKKLEFLAKIQKLKQRTRIKAEEIDKLIDECPADDDMKYELLVKRAQIELDSNLPKSKDKAISFLLRATIIQPNRPEANVMLANIYANQADLISSTKHINAASSERASDNYEFICFQVQNHMDAGNYYAALELLGKTVCNTSSPWFRDPYLSKRLYECVLKDSTPDSTWSPLLFSKLYGVPPEQLYKIRDFFAVEITKRFRNVDGREADRFLNRILSNIIVDNARGTVDENAYSIAGDGRFEPKPKVFSFSRSSMYDVSDERINFAKDIDLFELMLKASVDDPNRLKDLLTKLNKIRTDAKNYCKSASSDKEAAEKLFVFLKENLLSNYSVVEGIPAENAILKKDYLCLTGALYYTLIARQDLNLNVYGMLIPGHAYAVHEDKDEKVRVETTGAKDPSSSNYGFNAAGSDGAGKMAFSAVSASKAGGLLFRTNLEGPISPLDLVVCQYRNVVLNLPTLLVLHDEQSRKLAVNLLKKTLTQRDIDNFRLLREEFEKKHGVKQNDWGTGFSVEDVLDTMGIVYIPQMQTIKKHMILKMAEESPDFKVKLQNTYRKMRHLMETAFELDPFAATYKNTYCQIMEQTPILELRPGYVRLISATSQFNAQSIKKKTNDYVPASKGEGSSAAPEPPKSDAALLSDEKIERIEDRKTKQQKIIEEYSAITKTLPEVTSNLERYLVDLQLTRQKYPQVDEIRRLYLQTASQLDSYIAAISAYYKMASDSQISLDPPNLSTAQNLASRFRKEFSN